MRVIHSVGDLKKEGEGEGAFLLSDKRGGYLCLPNSKSNESNFQGWFSFKDWNMFKTIENIYLDKDVDTIHNKFSHVERDSGPVTERFFLYKDALIYEIFNHEGFVNVDFDFRYVYDFSDKGRMFEFYPTEGGVLMVKYQKYKDENLQELDYEKFMAIKNAQDYWVTGEWLGKCYPYDKRRKSHCEFYVYGTLQIKLRKDSRIIFAHADTEEDALRKVNGIWHDLHLVMNNVERNAIDELKEKDIATNAAINCLNNLKVKLKVEGRDSGVFAGFPWFFQFWARDEFISSKALMLLEDHFLVKGMLLEYLRLIRDDGFMDNRNVESDLESADSTGLLFMRYHDFLLLLEGKVFDYFTKYELEEVKDVLDKAIDNIMKYHTQDGLIVNGNLETWMDTFNEGDFRNGARIEIQAYYLRMCQFGSYLGKLIGHDTKKYDDIEKKLKQKVKNNFFNNGMLADGFTDSADMTQRPNVFLAYYAYPDLLSKKDWESVFDNALKKLWLDWGGLSSIDKENSLFRDEYTGQDNQSYHRGDSWYYINNLAALCMHRLNPKKYGKYVTPIVKASSQEMLFSGYLGQCSEISSAKELSSFGARCQAWSAATFIELMDELE